MGDRVERFEAKHSPYEMVPSKQGNWVHYSDYERLEEERDELHSDNVGEEEIRLEARHAIETVEAERDQARKQVLEG